MASGEYWGLTERLEQCLSASPLPASVVARLSTDRPPRKRSATRSPRASMRTRWRRRPSRSRTGAGRWPCISASRRTRPRCARWSRSPPAPAAANALASSGWRRKDWVRASLEELTPVEAGRFVVHGAHDRARVARNRIGIEIEAALAFGTGHHGTTRGCLLALDRIVKQQGCRRQAGRASSTSAPAPACSPSRPRGRCASRCWRATSTPARSLVARDNARRNRAGAFVEVVHAAGLAARRFRARAPFRLIFANILLAPLRRLATPMARLVAPAVGSCFRAACRAGECRAGGIPRRGLCWNGAFRSRAG